MRGAISWAQYYDKKCTPFTWLAILVQVGDSEFEPGNHVPQIPQEKFKMDN